MKFINLSKDAPYYGVLNREVINTNFIAFGFNQTRD